MKNKLDIILFLLGLFIVSLTLNCSVLLAATYDLAASVNRGLSHNLKIQAKEIFVQEAEKGVQIAKGNFLPTLSFSRQQNRIGNNSGVEFDSDYLDQKNITTNFRVSQPIFAGFANLTALEKAKQVIVYRQLELNEAKLLLAREIRKQFINHLQLNDLFESVKASEKRLLKQLNAANAFFEQNMVPRLHVLQIEVELSRVRQQLIHVKTLSENSRKSLNQLLGFELDRQIEYNGEFSELSYEIIKSLDEYQSMSQLRPSISIAEINLDISKKETSLIMARNLPKVDLDMNYYDQGRDYDNPAVTGYDRKYWSAGVNLSFPVFQGGRNIRTFQQQMLSTKRNEKELNHLRQKVELESSVNYSLLLEAKDRIASTIEIKNESLESFQRAQTRYETGLGSIVDVLASQEKISKADIDINQARADFQIIKAELIYISGQDELFINK